MISFGFTFSYFLRNNIIAYRNENIRVSKLTEKCNCFDLYQRAIYDEPTPISLGIIVTNKKYGLLYTYCKIYKYRITTKKYVTIMWQSIVLILVHRPLHRILNAIHTSCSHTYVEANNVQESAHFLCKIDIVKKNSLQPSTCKSAQYLCKYELD